VLLGVDWLGAKLKSVFNFSATRINKSVGSVKEVIAFFFSENYEER